ncbi:uncharacterized protein LOC117181136 [Belonocnema kinseyi]|uniref:uncharacterized protein LOC117181136 n=1 Tax=Belonocnema kinseyi TaxID=2817044 RepID=UPI00143D2F31|nr:uncharacterized protein LOC117181136 [Belonocnema kinseyi]
MKCAIFCCLLALCALELVNADLNTRLSNLYLKSLENITKYITPKFNEIEDLVHSKQRKKHCLDTFNSSHSKLKTRKVISLNKCLQDGRDANDYMIADACCSSDIQSLQTAIDTMYNDAIKCLHRRSTQSSGN